MALLYVGLGVSFLKAILMMMTSSIGVAESTLLGFWWYLIHIIEMGRNWARITLLIWAIIGALFIVAQLSVAHPFVVLLNLGTTALAIIALVLLSGRRGRTGFGRWAQEGIRSVRCKGCMCVMLKETAR